MALASVGLCTNTVANESVKDTEAKHSKSSLLVAQDFTIPITVPQSDLYIHDPGMSVLLNGHLFVVAPVRRRRELEKPEWGPSPQATSLLLARSSDHGKTWQQLPTIPDFRDATPFVHNGSLYLLIPDYANNMILLMQSTDEGTSWSSPVTVLEEHLWNCQTCMTKRDGHLYWALTNWPRGNTLKSISVDLSRDLLTPKSWSVSSGCDMPRVPDLLKDAQTAGNRKRSPRPWSVDSWLEPNVVNVNGRLRVLSRVVIDDFATAGLGALCEIELNNDKEMNMKFSQFYPVPGGQCKFMIVYDETSRLFWMLSNIPTDSHDLFENFQTLGKAGFVHGPGNERRILTLHYSLDALNWFPGGIVAMWSNPMQSFMYPSAAIDNDDLVFISRTSRNAPNQHDADLVTFHRIRNFRSLAVDLNLR
jgi:hypothetical protein